MGEGNWGSDVGEQKEASWEGNFFQLHIAVDGSGYRWGSSQKKLSNGGGAMFKKKRRIEERKLVRGSLGERSFFLVYHH